MVAIANDSPDLGDSFAALNVEEVHRTTISRRATGKQLPRADYREQCQLLSHAQEATLLKHIDELTRRGLPPNHSNVRLLVA